MAASPSTEKEDAALGLTLAVVAASQGPLLLLDGGLNLLAVSRSFCQAFDINPAKTQGSIFALGHGEWDVPQLRSLLTGAAAGDAAIETYEFDLKRPGVEPRRLSVKPQVIVYSDLEHVRILVALADVTDALANKKAKEELQRENELLLREVRHRVANSLQIVASVLLQGARRSLSEETRSTLRNAHHRVMSVATLERELSPSIGDDVQIRTYLTKLCASIGDSMIADPKTLILEVSAPDIAIPANRAISLGLITTELVINALKHAFLDDRAGTIKVRYVDADGQWTLTITDDGVGMPSDPAAKVAGLGTSIVQALARQLGARSWCAMRTPALRSRSGPSGLPRDLPNRRSLRSDASDGASTGPRVRREIPQTSSRSAVGLSGRSTPHSRQVKPTAVGTRPFHTRESGSVAIRTGFTM
jgi:two-component sensor histidine kinase